jgi:hypothetical protein
MGFSPIINAEHLLWCRPSGAGVSCMGLPPADAGGYKGYAPPALKKIALIQNIEIMIASGAK